MMSAAKMDALMHAARRGCEPAIPLVQPETINPMKPPGILTVKCPNGCGASLSVPVVIVDVPSVSADAGELDVRFIAEAPELHHYIDAHMRVCPSQQPRSVATALHQSTG